MRVVAVFALVCALGALGRAAGQEFWKFRNCEECTQAGHGWCPIRRQCGGFATRKCIGGGDPRDVALPPVDIVTDSKLDITIFSSHKDSITLVYDAPSTDHAVLEVFGQAAEELVWMRNIKFYSYDASANSELHKRWPDVSEGVHFVFRGFGNEYSADAHIGGPQVERSLPTSLAELEAAGPEALVAWIKEVTTVNIPELDELARELTRIKFFKAEGTVEDVLARAEAFREANFESGSARDEIVSLYITVFNEVIEGGMGYVADSVNSMQINNKVDEKYAILSVVSNTLMGK